jgi:tetratricopeptide (TPR) repeat protein
MDYVLRGLGFFPESKALLLLKAQIEGLRGGHLAIPTLQNIHHRFPEDDRITAILAETCLRAGQTEEALAVLDKRIGSSSDQVPVLLEQIYMMALYKKGKIQEAGQLYEKMDREGRDPAGTLRRWAQLLAEDKKWKALGDLFREKDSPELLGMIADNCLRIGLEDESGGREMAAECLSFLIAEHPDQPALYLSLGRLYHYWKQYPSAEQIYRKILTLENPTDHSTKVIALNNLAWILSHESKNYQEALQMTAQGLAIQPDHADLLDTRGEIYFMTGEYEISRLSNGIRRI